MNYENQLQNLVDALNEASDAYDFRVNKARKYDYIEKQVLGNWQKVAAVVKTLDCKVCNGYIRTRVGDVVGLQSGGTPKRGSVKGTIFTEDDKLTDAFSLGSLVKDFAIPSWFRSEYEERTPNSRR